MKNSPIKNAFKNAKNENRPALLTYTVAGDNNKLNSLNILKRYKLTLCVGLCGSMTTFSSWMSHLYKLLNQGLYKLFLLNSLSIVLIGIVAIGLGHIFAKKLNA